jgi:hypothetical protein
VQESKTARFLKNISNIEINSPQIIHVFRRVAALLMGTYLFNGPRVGRIGARG